MLNRVLVANRGEIACRVFRSCADLGIGTAAVYSDADAAGRHVALADAAVRLPGDAAADTYLRADLVVDAALRCGADAVHPGYGFLSENAEFAAAVTGAGLTWVGPSPAAIASMGSKVEAKQQMAGAGVPVLSEVDPTGVTEAELPVLVKASAGGGGRGMRVVRNSSELDSQLELARAEAAAAFGDGTVFCEPYLATGRHIEVQVLADTHGTVLAVGERECSIQRRHQKIIEEAPSPLVERTPGMRERLYEAAVAAATAIGYTGAGTVEFLADETGRFYFLEMNTRLQVEHPVTECVTGLDLVAWQLRVAEGERLDPQQPAIRGHAIEARLYAEDPAADFAPQSGTLHAFDVPGVDAEFAVPPAPGLRLDSGVLPGDSVGVHYDPMLAKVIAFAPQRDAAARRLATALAGASIHGVRTNRDLLVRTLRHPAFLAGDTDTSFLAGHGVAELAAPLADAEAVRVSALAAALADAAAERAAAPVLGGLPSGWRNVASGAQQRDYADGEHEIPVRYRLTRAGLHAPGHPDVRLVEHAPDRVTLEVGGVLRTFTVRRHPGLVGVDSGLGSVSLVPLPRFADPQAAVAPGSLLAPTPGTVVRVDVSTSDSVKAGEPVLWLEAMKMQQQISAPCDGVVTAMHVRAGDQVDLGAVLAVVEQQPSDEGANP